MHTIVLVQIKLRPGTKLCETHEKYTHLGHLRVIIIGAGKELRRKQTKKTFGLGFTNNATLTTVMRIQAPWSSRQLANISPTAQRNICHWRRRKVSGRVVSSLNKSEPA